MGGEWTAGAVLVSESWPATHRGKAIGMMQSGWALGYILAAVVSAVIVPRFGWRWLFAAGVLPAVLVLWIQREVAEPDLWSRSRQHPRPRLAALMSQPEVFRNLLLALALSGTVMLAYWGLFTWIPNYLATPVQEGGVGLGLVKSIGWLVPMQAGAGRLSQFRLPFRPFWAASDLCRLPAWRRRGHPLLRHVGPKPGPLDDSWSPVGLLGAWILHVFGALLAELFPTELRATAQGLTSTLAGPSALWHH